MGKSQSARKLPRNARGFSTEITSKEKHLILIRKIIQLIVSIGGNSNHYKYLVTLNITLIRIFREIWGTIFANYAD